jgi:hypothetical protein
MYIFSTKLVTSFKVSFAIRRSNRFHHPTAMAWRSSILPQFPLPSSDSSITRYRSHYLGRNPTMFATEAVQGRFHGPRAALERHSIKMVGRLVCRFNKGCEILLKDVFGIAGRKGPHGLEPRVKCLENRSFPEPP